MPRARSPKRDEAYQIWLDSGKKKKLKDIASELGVSETQVRKWKNQDKWNSNVTNPNSSVTKRKQGAPAGNKNAVGHGAPRGNKNAEKYGFFSKYLPEETVSIIREMPEDPLDVLWDQIQIAYAAIIRAQRIMYVKDRDDVTTTKIAESSGETFSEKWEVQQSWDKQANFLQAQARAQKTLDGMINRYEDMLHKRWDLATEEQKARIEQIRANTERLKKNSNDNDGEDGVVIVNDAPAGEDIGHSDSEVPADIQQQEN